MNRIKVVKVLRDWGVWVREGRALRCSLGFPSASPCYRAAFGPGGGEPGARHPDHIPWDRELTRVDNAIKAMSALERKILGGIFIHSLSISNTALWLKTPKSTTFDRYNKALQKVHDVIEPPGRRKPAPRNGKT